MVKVFIWNKQTIVSGETFIICSKYKALYKTLQRSIRFPEDSKIAGILDIYLTIRILKSLCTKFSLQCRRSRKYLREKFFMGIEIKIIHLWKDKFIFDLEVYSLRRN